MKWRLINSGCLDGCTNMAIDEAMLALCGTRRGIPTTLRLYGWRPPAISMGYFQKMEQVELEGWGEERKELLNSGYEKIDIVRRPTGGGAILHDKELTFCLVADLKDSVIPEDVPASYSTICEAVISGLRILGIDARVRGNESAGAAPAVTRGGAMLQLEPFFCFARPSRYDIVFEGKKLVGSAQRRKCGILLHHGSILMDGENLHSSTSINSILGRKVELEELSRNIARGFEEKFLAELVPGELTEDEVAWRHASSVRS